MTPPSSDPSINNEPHLRSGHVDPDPSEKRTDKLFSRKKQPSSDDDLIDQTVWDEPALSRELAGAPRPGDLTYGDWIENGRVKTSSTRSWGFVFLLAILSGPWAVIGAFWGSGETAFSVIAIIVFGPVVEETMKLAAASVAIEKRPFLFQSRRQIAICALASGLAFASIENLIYIFVYLKDPPLSLIIWRLTACTALHTVCTFIGGLGLIRIWRTVWATHKRPQLKLGFPYLLAAVILHGSYNAFALLLAIIGYTF